jgi:LuxR family maltose regulon positive regulatory protein
MLTVSPFSYSRQVETIAGYASFVARSARQPGKDVPNQIESSYNVAMAEALLKTKLHAPALRTNIVPRQRLIERLDQGLQSGRRLTLVSAPAGFGKTTCVVEWLNTLQLPVAWLSLDPADNDPGRFFAYLVTALQQVDESLGQEIGASLLAGQLPTVEGISTALINDIQALHEPFLLILDDLQVIEHRLILQALEHLVTTPPDTLQLVLITREDPSLPLARLRANGRLTEIRMSDLRFRTAEADRFLSEAMGIPLSQKNMSLLEERTEGWIAGLQLAALSIRDRSDPSSFIANLSGSHRYILNYLTEEVLNQQPADIQLFLLQTAVLKKLNGDLCNALTGREDGFVLLEQGAKMALSFSNSYTRTISFSSPWTTCNNGTAIITYSATCSLPA